MWIHSFWVYIIIYYCRLHESIKSFKKLYVYYLYSILHTHFSCVWGSPYTWYPQIRLQSLVIWTYLLVCKRWSMPQGHQKYPHLLFLVNQLWHLWTGLPDKCFMMMFLLYFCSIYGFVHLHTSLILFYHTIFLLLGLFLTVLLSFMILWGFWGLVLPLLLCFPILCIPFT